eukprot:gene35605-46179_t
MKRNKITFTAALLCLILYQGLSQTALTPITWTRIEGFNFNPMPLVYPSVSTWTNYTTATIAACEDICNQGPGCDFYTFNSVSNVCDLKF